MDFNERAKSSLVKILTNKDAKHDVFKFFNRSTSQNTEKKWASIVVFSYWMQREHCNPEAGISSWYRKINSYLKDMVAEPKV